MQDMQVHCTEERQASTSIPLDVSSGLIVQE